MKTLDQRSAFSRNLVRLRKARNLSQAELAQLAGVTPAAIGHYESRAVNPPVSVILTLAKVLEVTVEELMGETPPEKKADDFSHIDPRILRKALEIAELSQKDRNIIYGMINKMKKGKDIPTTTNLGK